MMDELREKLSGMKSERVIELEHALRIALSHFSVSSVGKCVIYDGGIKINSLRNLVIILGEVPGFPEESSN